MPKPAAPAKGVVKAPSNRRQAQTDRDADHGEPKTAPTTSRAPKGKAPKKAPPKVSGQASPPSEAGKSKSKNRSNAKSKKVAKGSAKAKSKKVAKKSSETRIAVASKPTTVSRATILPSQRTDHTTPPIVLEGVVYPVLGDPVDLDPCSNAKSIVRARSALRKEHDGLAAEWRVRTLYLNPPYGKEKGTQDSIIDWIRKAIVSNRLYGTEIIALVPASPSAEWWDMVEATANCIAYWGPGDGNRRIKFGGNANQAAFHSALIYWGPNLADFALHAGRFCHLSYPLYNLSLTRALIGGRPRKDDPLLPLPLLDQLFADHRHDDLVSALACAGNTPLGTLMDAATGALRSRLRALTCHELGTALMLASRCRTRPWVHASELPLRVTSKEDPRQIPLLAEMLSSRSPEPPAVMDRVVVARTLEQAVVEHLRMTPSGLRRGELHKRIACTSGEIKGALQRLLDLDKITMDGRTRAAIYRLKEEGKPNDETRHEDPRDEEPRAPAEDPRPVAAEPQPDSPDFWPGPA